MPTTADHYDRCLQATRGGFARVLPFEWAIAVGSTGSLPRHAAALPEIEASSLALRLAIPERAASIAMDPGEDSVIAEQGPQPQGPVWAELGHADENEKTGVTGRLLAAVRWLRTEDHVRSPRGVGLEEPSPLCGVGSAANGRAIWNPFAIGRGRGVRTKSSGGEPGEAVHRGPSGAGLDHLVRGTDSCSGQG